MMFKISASQKALWLKALDDDEADMQHHFTFADWLKWVVRRHIAKKQREGWEPEGEEARAALDELQSPKKRAGAKKV